MEKLTLFKEFVRNNPSLIKFVKNNEMSWQKFYEMYDIYGENDEVWNEYLNNSSTLKKNKTSNSLSDLISVLKNIDLDSLQEGISSVQRVVGVLGDLALKKNNEQDINEYKPRPLYKHFDD